MENYIVFRLRDIRGHRLPTVRYKIRGIISEGELEKFPRFCVRDAHVLYTPLSLIPQVGFPAVLAAAF